MTTPSRTSVVLALLGAMLAAPAQAEDSPTPQFSFSGYGTVGAIHSNDNRADYLVDAFKPTGPGYTHSWASDTGSRLGLQASAQLGYGFSAVVQVLAQQNYQNSYRPGVEWANLKYQITPDLSVRAGRVVQPVFMVSDTRRVGYANPWVRPPVEVYSLVPVTYSDGVDASWRLATEMGTNTLQVTAGRSDSNFPDTSGAGAGTANVRNLLSVNDTWENGFLTLRASYGRASLTIESLNPLFDAFRQFGPPGDAVADKYDVNNRKVDFVGFGAAYDPGQWFVMGEWAMFNTHSVLGAREAWYVSGGYRVNKFTPYATYARLKAASNTSDPGLPLAGLPPPLVPTAVFLNTSLNQQLQLPQQYTVSLGVRWDFIKNAALKLQYDSVQVTAGSNGTFGNVQPGFQPAGRVQLFSAVLDFVF